MILTVVFRYAGVVLQFVILTALARTLSPHDYGRYLFVLSAVLPTYFLLGLGASDAFVREAPRARVDDDIGTVPALAGSSLAMALGMATVVVAIGGATILLAPVAAATKALMWFVLVFFVANGLMFNASQVLLGAGAQRLGAFFFYPAVNLTLLLSSVPYALLASRPSFDGVALVTAAAACAAALVALVTVMATVRPRLRRIEHRRSLVRLGVKLVGARTLYSVGIWLPTFIAGLLLSPTQAGYLGTAGRLAVAVAAVTAAIRFAVRPAIVRAFAAEDRAAIRSICGSLATTTLALAALALIANLLIGHMVVSWVFGPQFAPVVPLLSLLLIAFAAEAVGGPVDEVLKMTGHEDRVLVVFLIAVPALVVALVFASGFGVRAMAGVQVVYSALVFGSLIWSARSVLGMWLHPTLPPTVSGLVHRAYRLRSG